MNRYERDDGRIYDLIGALFARYWRLGAFALVLLVAACPPNPPVNPGPDADATAPPDDAGDPAPRDAAPVVDAGDLCARACERLATTFRCPEGARATCIPACHRDQDAGVASMLHPDCVLEAGAREDLLRCGVRCK